MVLLPGSLLLQGSDQVSAGWDQPHGRTPSSRRVSIFKQYSGQNILPLLTWPSLSVSKQWKESWNFPIWSALSLSADIVGRQQRQNPENVSCFFLYWFVVLFTIHLFATLVWQTGQVKTDSWPPLQTRCCPASPPHWHTLGNRLTPVSAEYY